MTAYEATTVQINTSEFGSCALVQDLLPLYMEGEVSPGSRDTIVEHLARCERCAGFLAGAQSVRAQLRRDRSDRERVIERAAPARHALRAGQKLVSLIALLILCSLGAIATLMLWYGIEHFPPMFLGGAVLGLAALGGLAAHARRQRRMSLPRWVVLFASCVLGALGTLFVMVTHEPPAIMLGLILLTLALSGVWTSVFQGGRRLAEE